MLHFFCLQSQGVSVKRRRNYDPVERLTEKDHQLRFSNSRNRCRVCFKMNKVDKRVKTQCNKCLQPLCAVNCFYIYHNKSDF